MLIRLRPLPLQMLHLASEGCPTPPPSNYLAQVSTNSMLPSLPFSLAKTVLGGSQEEFEVGGSGVKAEAELYRDYESERSLCLGGQKYSYGTRNGLWCETPMRKYGILNTPIESDGTPSLAISNNNSVEASIVLRTPTYETCRRNLVEQVSSSLGAWLQNGCGHRYHFGRQLAKLTQSTQIESSLLPTPKRTQDMVNESDCAVEYGVKLSERLANAGKTSLQSGSFLERWEEYFWDRVKYVQPRACCSRKPKFFIAESE
ncbi:hypothetical protein L204_105620 [Cryptococcus depauperatus]